jgi:hypothetical protein
MEVDTAIGCLREIKHDRMMVVADYLKLLRDLKD